jgi:hypothetical protein
VAFSEKLHTIGLCLRFVIAVDPNEFTWSEIEGLHQETSDAAEILDLIISIGGLVADNFDGLVGLANSDDVKGPIAVAVTRRRADESCVREIEKRCAWDFSQAAAPNVQSLTPLQTSKIFHIGITVRREVAAISADR